MNLTPNEIQLFQKTIYDFYMHNKRDFPWRRNYDPYHILVSEIMLQQTQTDRVRKKFEEFIAAFPTFHDLASASVSQVLAQWQGLGYNRRALALQKCALRVMEEFDGSLPHDPELLITFPGIGKATAASIAAFAFNSPTMFIETNIRTVFIHHFYSDSAEVDDKEILPLVEQTLDRKNPREWYSALMDYGVMLKQKHGNAGKRSRQYRKQSKFEGSDRQVRGNILKLLLEEPSLSATAITRVLDQPSDRVEKILKGLEKEGFLERKKKNYSLK